MSDEQYKQEHLAKKKPLDLCTSTHPLLFFSFVEQPLILLGPLAPFGTPANSRAPSCSAMSRSPLERSNSVASGIDSDDEIVEELDENDILGHLELTATPDENTSSSSPQRELGTLRGGLPTAFTANSSTSPQRIAVTVQSPKPHLNVAIPNLNDYDTSPARRNVSGSSTLMPPPSPPRLFLEQQRRDEKKREKEKEQEQTTCCARSHAFWFPASLPTSWGYQITWIVDAVVMSILKYVFCVVGAVIIHDSHKMFKQSLAIGIGVQCASTFVTCLITSGYSKLGINISGPDIIAAIFAGQWASALTDPSALTIVTEIQALPTLLFLIAASTLIMGLLWLAIGYTGATRVVDFMPQPVVSGFLACIGWKVLKYAAKVSTGPAWYTWDAPGFTWPFFMLLLPAIPLGVPLYLLKRFHIGDPMVVLPVLEPERRAGVGLPPARRRPPHAAWRRVWRHRRLPEAGIDPRQVARLLQRLLVCPLRGHHLPVAGIGLRLADRRPRRPR